MLKALDPALTLAPKRITLGRVPNSRARRSSSPDWRRSCWPGIVSATALAASVSEPERFRSGRQFAASLGLTPLQNCSGGKERLGRISRMGDRYLRRLLVVGMTSLIRRAKATPTSVDPQIGRAHV